MSKSFQECNNKLHDALVDLLKLNPDEAFREIQVIWRYDDVPIVKTEMMKTEKTLNLPTDFNQLPPDPTATHPIDLV